MNEFNFRVANAAPRASGFEIGQNVGDTKTTCIYSYKTKYINGKSTGQKTNVGWYMESSIPSWVSVKYVFEGNDCKVTFTTLQENTGSSARTHTLVMKQRESGETISFPISQEPNFTYTYFLEVLDVSSTVGANIGATTLIMVQSYMTRSDGEKMAKQPSVGATPSFASKVTVKDGSVMAGAPHWYQIVVEATAANIGSSERSETLLVTCGDQRKEVTIWQKAADTSIQNNGIIIYVYSDSSTQGKGVIQVVADHPVASNISIVMYIQYGVSPGNVNQYNLTLAKGQYLLNQKFDIQIGAHPQVLSYDYSPKEDSSYRYSVQIFE